MNQKVTAASAEVSPLMKELSEYLARALKQPLPQEVVEKTKHHVLDTVAAMVARMYRHLPERMHGAAARSVTPAAVDAWLSALARHGRLTLADVLAAFEDLAHLAADLAGDVLVVKFIGDAAMLVSGHHDQLVDACLRIVDAEVEALGDVARRAGIASGRVQIRDGDYVGTPVNLAARLTDLARPSTVVADEALHDALEARWELSRLPSLKLKGLGRGRHLRVRHPQS